MSYRDITLSGADSCGLSARLFDQSAPAGVLLIVHGMQEHKGRYDDFASFLQRNGFAVMTFDLRGHGPDAPQPGHIADRDGHRLLVQDVLTLARFLRQTYPGAAQCLLGHSMGSFVVRNVLQTNSRDFNRVVLTGYPKPQPAEAGIALARAEMRIKGPKGRSALLDRLITGPFPKSIPNAETPFDWLSHDRENIRKYIGDPLCGVPFTLGSYLTLLGLLGNISRPGLYRDVRADLPILLISGRDDPCTGGEKGRKASFDCLARAGFTNIHVQTLDHMRHEILNETDRELAYRMILSFLDPRA